MSHMSYYPGKLITFEGSDGTGKTTQAKLLAKSLSADGAKVLEVREPGGTHLGERLRGILLDPESEICTRAELLIYEASRAQLIEDVIRPALESGQIVICDRFTDSTIAYQGIGRSLGSGIVSILNDFATSGITPDATVVLRCSYRESESRRHNRGDSDRMELEGDAFLQRVDEAFDEMGEHPSKAAGKKDGKKDGNGRIRAVDADGPVDEVAFRVRQALSDVLGPIDPAGTSAISGGAASLDAACNEKQGVNRRPATLSGMGDGN